MQALRMVMQPAIKLSFEASMDLPIICRMELDLELGPAKGPRLERRQQGFEYIQDPILGRNDTP